MTIEITRPEVETLINQWLHTGKFVNAEDVIFHALQASAERAQQQGASAKALHEPIWDEVV